MLQLASWELRRRRHKLLTLGTPARLALNRMTVNGQYRIYSAVSPKVTIEKDEPTALGFDSKFSTRRTDAQPISSKDGTGTAVGLNMVTGEVIDEEDATIARYENFELNSPSARSGAQLDAEPDHERRNSVAEKEPDFKTFLSSPTFLLEKIVLRCRERPLWRQNVALLREKSVKAIIMQMYIRTLAMTELTTVDNRDGAERLRQHHQALPKGQEHRELMDFMLFNGYTYDDILSLAHILRAPNDQQRAERFLESDVHKPIFMLHFVIRPTASIKVATFSQLLDYCLHTYDGRRRWKHKDLLSTTLGRSRMPMLAMGPAQFAHTIRLLIRKSYYLDSRLVVKVAHLVAQYLENMAGWDHHPDRIYKDRCFLFNEALQALSTRTAAYPPKKHYHLLYVWEAQRTLLATSATFDRPLQVVRAGFQSIRLVLAGLDKNKAETHSSKRHAASWPPYLKPGDGIDQMMDPEEGWSRSVQAGVLQQEAGFPEDSLDEAMDTLQGRSPDGTPTIQQRVAAPPAKHYSAWEASIRATRNVEEAWARFKHPPQPDMEPTVYEFAALFAKFYLPDSGIAPTALPGDRALNFQSKPDPNLSEFGLSQLTPPSVGELYRHMKSRGIRPESTCLEILVRNAPTMEDGHRYLLDNRDHTSLTTWYLYGLVPEDLRDVPITLFAAYVQLCARQGGLLARHITRAIRLCELRFELGLRGDRPWAPLIWGQILKELSSNRFGNRKSLASQLRLCVKIMIRLEELGRVQLSTMMQFAKTLKKSIRKQLDEVVVSLEKDSFSLESGRLPQTHLAVLYRADSKARLDAVADDLAATLRNTEEPGTPVRDAVASIRDEGLSEDLDALTLFTVGRRHLKRLYRASIDDEAAAQDVLQSHQPEALDVMASRTDPVRAADAYDLMLSFAFLGEFEEMATYMGWLLQQWSAHHVVEAVERLGEVPAIADLSKVLYAFRLLAEPVLDPEVVEEVRLAVENSPLGWVWPDDEAVQLFAEMEERQEQGLLKLVHVLKWVQHRWGMR